MAAYRTVKVPGGTRHIWPNGRNVFIKAPTARINSPRADAPGAPGATGAAGVSYDIGGTPIDYAAENQKAVSRQQLALGAASDTYDRSQLSNEYGFGDTSNPYSRAMMLEASYKKNQGSNTNSYAKQGQLYSGALQTAQNAATGSYNQSYDTLRRDYAKGQNAISQRALSRYSNAGTVMDDATYNSIQRGLTGLGA